MFTYTSIAELVEAAEKSGKKISELVLADQAESMEQSQAELFDRMSTDLDVMIDAVKFGEKKDQKSTSGLTGGEGWKMNDYTARLETVCRKNDSIAPHLYDEYSVNKGLRDANGNGVLAGLTNISKITSFKMVD